MGYALNTHWHPIPSDSPLFSFTSYCLIALCLSTTIRFVVMVKLDLVQSSNAALVSSQPLVAVFVGGTSGIGSHTIRSLAVTHGKDGKGLRAYIIGRNAKAAENIISECQKSCPAGQFHFLQAKDLALIKDVDLICEELIEKEKKEAAARGEIPRIDLLVQTQAIFKPWDPRNGMSDLCIQILRSSCFGLTSDGGSVETSEGLDTFISLLYYSRMRFITKLLSILLASRLPARVISVYGPGRDSTFVPDDLSLRSPKNYGFMNSGSHAAYLTTFFMEYLATQHPGKLALVHYFPGLILGDVFMDPTFPLWFRTIFKYGMPLIKLSPMTLSGDECGARTLFNASSRFPPRLPDGKPAEVKDVGPIGVAESSDGILGGGAYRVNYNNEQVATGSQYKKLREGGWLDKCVKHTFKAWEEIEAGRVFAE